MESILEIDQKSSVNVGASSRELKRHYIPASAADIQAMLQSIGLNDLEDLFAHIPAEVRFDGKLPLPEELSYEAVQERMRVLSEKNRPMDAFLGDGLEDWTVSEIVPYVANLRNLTTSYTPYQPERSQGTLMGHWIYQCLLSQLTGFEAINTSLYERSTALYEAICCAIRLAGKGCDTVLIPAGLYPGDREVLETLTTGSAIHLVTVPLDSDTGCLDPGTVDAAAAEHKDRLAAIVFPQVNSLGLLEDVDTLADIAVKHSVKSIAVIDPMLLATGGLKPPNQFGQNGVDIIVGEGQHLAIGPNFGGPGLGIFGVRHNDSVKTDIRSTPGRYVGKARDISGRECHVAVLSTREQHIRKEKATSNICSNQAFLATLAGAALLAKGEEGLAEAVDTARKNARWAVDRLTAIPGVALAFPETPFFNEILLHVPCPVSELIQHGRTLGLHIGVDVSDRIEGGERLLKVAFSDKHTAGVMERLYDVFKNVIGETQTAVPQKISARSATVLEIPLTYLRSQAVGMPQFEFEDIKRYYAQLAELNVSPDNACYPLGSCTMKYNPKVNDWAANLPGFTQVHPQAPIEDVQGCLEILFEIQEWFKGITGLAAVTTQPVAGAQGELVGLKLFQAVHRARGETQRDVTLIPKSAHGTNFATAAMAGFQTRPGKGQTGGIVLLEADAAGCIDRGDLDVKIEQYGDRISGIMITNPNTGGIFETDFKAIAEKVHAVGGYVYMDGANMNAIAGWVNLGALGVDAVHNNLHKTWTIPHGGGGPGDAIVAVSEQLKDFLPGYQIVREEHRFKPVRPPHSIGSFHRHWGNFAHKVRCYTYLLRLGHAGIQRMSAVAVLSARYLCAKLSEHFPTLPQKAASVPRMHEFILTLEETDFAQLAEEGIPKAAVMPSVGKLFLDFGFHAPTVAFPEVYGLMIEPTESYTKAELDRLSDVTLAIQKLIREKPEVLNTAPHFTPVDRVDEVTANRKLELNERLTQLPVLPKNRIAPDGLNAMPIEEIFNQIVRASKDKARSAGSVA